MTGFLKTKGYSITVGAILVVLFILFTFCPVSAEVQIRFSTPAPPLEILVKSMDLFKEKLFVF